MLQTVCTAHVAQISVSAALPALCSGGEDKFAKGCTIAGLLKATDSSSNRPITLPTIACTGTVGCCAHLDSFFFNPLPFLLQLLYSLFILSSDAFVLPRQQSPEMQSNHIENTIINCLQALIRFSASRVLINVK